MCQRVCVCCDVSMWVEVQIFSQYAFSLPTSSKMFSERVDGLKIPVEITSGTESSGRSLQVQLVADSTNLVEL